MRTLEDRLTQASDEARFHVNQIDTRSATSIRSRQQLSRTLVGTVAFAAMLIVFGASALVMSGGTGEDSASAPSTPPTTAIPVEEPVASTLTPLPSPAVVDITHLVGNITASTELSTEFGADRLIDGDFERSWHDASFRGVGAEIVLEFTEPVAITEIIVHPYTDEERFALNYWVQDYDIHTDDLAQTFTGRFANQPVPQVVGLKTNETLTLTFTVVTTYPSEPVGDVPPYDELAIAEIQVFGTTSGSIVFDDAAIVESVSTLPTIAIESTDWIVLWAEESVVPVEEAASSYGVDYAVVKSLLRYIHLDRGTMTAKIWTTGLIEGTVDETGWLGLNRADALVVSVRGHEARILDDGSDYVIAWRENPDTIVQVTVNIPGMEDVEADALVEAVAASLVDIAFPEWNSYLALPHDYDRYSSATTTLP